MLDIPRTGSPADHSSIAALIASCAEPLREFDDSDFGRHQFGEACALVGLGTHKGTVAAASEWDGRMEIKTVRPSLSESHERLFHDTGLEPFLLDFHRNGVLGRALRAFRLERFIGVIYRPESERMSHYAQASLSRQFDAFLWFDETSAVTPLGPPNLKPGVPETYPFGL